MLVYALHVSLARSRLARDRQHVKIVQLASFLCWVQKSAGAIQDTLVFRQHNVERVKMANTRILRDLRLVNRVEYIGPHQAPAKKCWIVFVSVDIWVPPREHVNWKTRAHSTLTNHIQM